MYVLNGKKHYIQDTFLLVNFEDVFRECAFSQVNSLRQNQYFSYINSTYSELLRMANKKE